MLVVFTSAPARVFMKRANVLSNPFHDYFHLSCNSIRCLCIIVTIQNVKKQAEEEWHKRLPFSDNAEQ
jgi:hypothetical protein